MDATSILYVVTYILNGSLSFTSTWGAAVVEIRRISDDTAAVSYGGTIVFFFSEIGETRQEEIK